MGYAGRQNVGVRGSVLEKVEIMSSCANGTDLLAPVWIPVRSVVSICMVESFTAFEEISGVKSNGRVLFLLSRL